jgi:hypothetical protein
MLDLPPHHSALLEVVEAQLQPPPAQPVPELTEPTKWPQASPVPSEWVNVAFYWRRLQRADEGYDLVSPLGSCLLRRF